MQTYDQSSALQLAQCAVRGLCYICIFVKYIQIHNFTGNTSDASLRRSFTEGGLYGLMAGAVLGPVLGIIQSNRMNTAQLFHR